MLLSEQPPRGPLSPLAPTLVCLRSGSSLPLMVSEENRTERPEQARTAGQRADPGSGSGLVNYSAPAQQRTALAAVRPLLGRATQAASRNT